MAYKDLREFIQILEQNGLLKRIKTEVDCELEITEIADRMVKQNGPALLFENVKGYSIPVLINTFASYERMNLALEVDNLNQIADRIRNLLKLQMPTGIWEKILMLPKLAELSNYIPKQVKSGPCKEVIIKDNPQLSKFPILKCWPNDGGRFITLPMVFTKDPETGIRNVGMYRMQVYDDRTTGMHWHIHKHGARHYEKSSQNQKRLEVAVAIGADPATMYASTAPVPEGIDEMLFAGFLRKEPVELVQCETVDLEIPAYSEIVLEGYVDPEERRIEGPFGDHTGFYSPADLYPVFHITCITHRNNPIYPATIVGKPPMEDCYFGKATERIFLPLLQILQPEIVDMNLPIEGVFHNCAIISIRKSYPGQARKVMQFIWGLGQMMFTKLIIIVDAEVDVQNLSEVAWKVFNNIDAKRDVTIVEGPVDVLDHAAPQPNYGSKMGIDATRKFPEETNRPWPEEITMNEDIKKLVDIKWNDYGL
ncbi:MAG: menaquinone biosynthesis decarboxylase [bacterium]|nr:menaquinone biosynthesis decarboxylase [bacterium]